MSGISGKFRSSGFTLIELMIVVALVAIAATYAVPTFSEVIANSRLTSTSNALVGALNYARGEAVKRGRPVEVTAISSAGDTNEWGGGWRVWVDAGTSGYDAGEEVRIFDSVPGSITIDGPNSVTSFRFRPNGFVDPSPISGTVKEYSFKLCDSRSGESGHEINIGAAGRIRHGTITCV